MTATSSSESDLLYEIRDGVGWVTLNRPQARNALTFAMYDRLTMLCSQPAERGEVRALVLIGAGTKAFASGTDISQFREFRTEEDAYGYEERIDSVMRAVEECPLPTIAAVRGACTGGGANLASSCDLRIGSPSVRMGFPVARTLGNCLSIASYGRLAALVGAARTKEIVFTARLVDAAQAAAMGWLNEVVDDEDALVPRVEELARTVAGHAPLTLLATKIALRRIRDTTIPAEGRDLVKMCYMSDDFHEGVDAFLSKRKPDWQGH